MGSNNPSVFYRIIYQVALCRKIFSLEIQEIMDTEILTMDYFWCKGLINQSVTTFSEVISEYDDDDDDEDYNSKVMAHYRCSYTDLFNCELK